MRRHGASQPIRVLLIEDNDLSVALVDVDRFRHVNDRYGHQVGDEVLRILARLLGEDMRAEDIAGRYGTDEFCLVLPHVSADEVLAPLHRIRARLAAVSFEPSPGETFRLTATFGTASLGDETDTAPLFDAARQAAYCESAARAGRVVHRQVVPRDTRPAARQLLMTVL